MLIAYLRERLRPGLFVALALFIAAATGETRWRFLPAVGFALLLLVQFRVWDDLADRRRDAIDHPERVLVRAPEVTTVIAFCGALGVLNLCLAVWRDASGIAVGALALLDLGLGSLYLVRAASQDNRAGSQDPAYKYRVRSLAGDHLLLAKYPVIVFVVAGARVVEAPVQILAAAAALYAGACAYEAWHDPGSPLARRYPALAAKHTGGER